MQLSRGRERPTVRSWIKRLERAAKSGVVLDLASHLTDQELVSSDPSTWPARQRIPAEAIRKVLLSSLRTDPRGLRIRGCYVTGILECDFVTLACPLQIRQSAFDSKLSFFNSVISELDLSQSSLAGLDIERATVAGSLTLRGIRCEGSIHGKDSQISGRLLLEGAQVNGMGDSLMLNGLRISGSAVLKQIRTKGRITARNANFGAILDLSGAVLGQSEDYSVLLRNSSVEGNFLINSADLGGALHAYGTQFGADVYMEHSMVRSPRADAIFLNRACVANNLRIYESAILGSLKAHSASIAGELDLRGTTVGGDVSSVGVDLARIKVSANSLLQDLKVRGCVFAHSAKLEGDLAFHNAIISAPQRPALVLSRAVIGGDAGLFSIELEGAIYAVGTRFQAGIQIVRSKFSKPEKIDFQEQSFYLIANLDHASVAEVARIEDSSFDGIFSGFSLTVSGIFAIVKVALARTDLSSSNITNLVLRDYLSLKGPINLRGATVGTLDVGPKVRSLSLPKLADAHGWRVGTIHGYLRTDRKALKSWLSAIPVSAVNGPKRGFSSQPWKAMAQTLDSMGQPEDARWLLRKAAGRSTKCGPNSLKPIRLIFAALVGYGYRPWRVIPWLISLFLATCLLCIGFAQDFTPVDLRAATVTAAPGQSQVLGERMSGRSNPGPPNYPEFSPWLFAVDTTLPVAMTGQSAAWRVTENEWLPATFSVFKAFAWSLTALLLAAITGLLRKD